MSEKMKMRHSLIAVLMATLWTSTQAADMSEAVGKAVLTNPDVLSKWHQFKSSGSERDISWGRYLPTLDYVYGVGRSKKSDPITYINPVKYDIEDSRASLKWNLFDGLATTNDVARLEHAQLVRYYEFLDISETAATEAARAYIDVFRFQKLLDMAEKNYATHRLMYEKINDRAKSGVGRGVDMEMAAARLALAESNLLTEASNLHDVTARYQRIVGEQPDPNNLVTPPSFAAAMPSSRTQALSQAFQSAPQLKAAIENILSYQRNVPIQRAGYLPSVDAYMESTRGNVPAQNTGNSLGPSKADTVGVTMTWNLFRGFRDRASIEKTLQDAYVAKDTRERVCRDLRQNLSVAYNDYLRAKEQLPFLDQHQLSADKAREALRRQFDIGQRTLLDVLDTENEYYTASRNYTNGEMDMLVAQVKYLGSAGLLLDTLKLKRLELTPPKQPDTPLDADAVNQCPPIPAHYPDFNKDAVFVKMKAKEDLQRALPAPPQAPMLPSAAPSISPAVSSPMGAAPATPSQSSSWPSWLANQGNRPAQASQPLSPAPSPWTAGKTTTPAAKSKPSAR